MTENDKKLILEWCGFKLVSKTRNKGKCLWRWKWESKTDILYFEGVAYTLDLDNLFKYALPKLEGYFIGNISAGHVATAWYQGTNYTARNKDPAEAFGQALLSLIKAIDTKTQRPIDK